MPEATIDKRREVTFVCQTFEWFPFPDSRIVIDIVDDFRGQNEIATVDPSAVTFGLFIECRYRFSIDVQCTKAPRRLRGGKGGERALAAVKRDKFANVHVAETIAVGEAEVIVTKVLRNAFQATAGHGVLAGVDECDAPRLGVVLMDFHPGF